MAELFCAGSRIQSDTEYIFDVTKSHIYREDTVCAAEAKYLTIPGEPVHAKALQTAFYLKNLQNVTLDFGGAVITLHGRIQPFLLDGCKNVTIRNVTVEYDRSFYTEFEIIGREEGALRVRPKEKFPCRVENGYFIPYSEEWENRTMHRDGCYFLQAFDNETHDGAGIMVAYVGEEIVELESPPAENIPHMRVRAEGEDILFFGEFPEHWNAGISVVLTHEGRDLSGAASYHCEDLVFENYRILNGAGMGFYSVYTKNIQMRNVRFCADEKSHGIVSNAADCVHFVACKGKIEICDSIFEGMIDDGMNVHANYYHTVCGEKNVISARRSSLSYGLNAYSRVFDVGDEIAVYRGRTLEEKDRFQVCEVRITGEWTIELVVDHSAEHLDAEDLIENLSTNPELIVRRSRFAKSNTHLRLQTRAPILVEECFFGIQVMLFGDTKYWFEASPVERLTIRNCTFSGAHAQICSAAEFFPTERAPYYHSGILIEENSFTNHTPLVARDTANVIFRNNRSEDEEDFLSELTNCTEIQFDPKSR